MKDFHNCREKAVLGRGPGEDDAVPRSSVSFAEVHLHESARRSVFVRAEEEDGGDQHTTELQSLRPSEILV